MNTPDPLTVLTAAPRRIQLSRAKGWRKPEGAVVVSRPTKWGNPYCVVTDPGAFHVIWKSGGEEMYHAECESLTEAREVAAAEYETHLDEHPELVEQARRDLAGKDLACWCPLDSACHVDVLLRVANEPVASTATKAGEGHR